MISMQRSHVDSRRQSSGGVEALLRLEGNHLIGDHGRKDPFSARNNPRRHSARPETKLPDLPHAVTGGLGIIGHTGDLIVTCPAHTVRREVPEKPPPPKSARTDRASLVSAGVAVLAPATARPALPSSARQSLPVAVPPPPTAARPPELEGIFEGGMSQPSSPSRLKAAFEVGLSSLTSTLEKLKIDEARSFTPRFLQGMVRTVMPTNLLQKVTGTGSTTVTDPGPYENGASVSDIPSSAKLPDGDAWRQGEPGDLAGAVPKSVKAAALEELSGKSQPMTGSGSPNTNLTASRYRTGSDQQDDNPSSLGTRNGLHFDSKMSVAAAQETTPFPSGVQSRTEKGASSAFASGSRFDAATGINSSAEVTSNSQGISGADGAANFTSSASSTTSTVDSSNAASTNGRGLQNLHPQTASARGSRERSGSRRPSRTNLKKDSHEVTGVVPTYSDGDNSSSNSNNGRRGSRSHESKAKNKKEKASEDEISDEEEIADEEIGEFMEALFAQYSSTKDNHGRPLLNTPGVRRFVQDFLGVTACAKAISLADGLYDDELQRQQDMCFVYDMSKGEAGRGLSLKAFIILLREVASKHGSPRELARQWFVKYATNGSDRASRAALSMYDDLNCSASAR